MLNISKKKSVKSYKIHKDVLVRLMDDRNLNAKKLQELLHFKSVEGFNKILREESTKEQTLRNIAHHLGVHASVISPDFPPMAIQQTGNANDAILRHERAINQLKSHIIKLYKVIGRELSEEQIDELNKL